MTRATTSSFARLGAATLAAVMLYAFSTHAAPINDQAAVRSSPYRESIAGTLVSFEMVFVPGSGAIRGFYLGRTEVTWDLYDLYALELERPSGTADATARPSRPYGAPDRGWGHAGYPAISITRDGAEAFAVWLSARTGTPYRLPTDAEWQHAATLAIGDRRASLDAIAWHRGNASARTHPVGSLKPDALGLFDLFGNAAEWVMTTDGTRVTRGGSFRDPLAALGPETRAVQDDSWNERDPQLPKSRWWLSDGPFVGFRLARSTP